jgi:hypothetical protein
VRVTPPGGLNRRRRLLGAAAGAANRGRLGEHEEHGDRQGPSRDRGSLSDVKHVVILMQENRSFDTDIPFHYALADAFTICDQYHCSLMGGTTPEPAAPVHRHDPPGRQGRRPGHPERARLNPVYSWKVRRARGERAAQPVRHRLSGPGPGPAR